MANFEAFNIPVARSGSAPAERDWPVDAELIGRLANPGCPLCAQLRADEPRYYFWLLHESYMEPSTLDGFAAARGVCQRHGVALAQNAIVPTAIEYLLSYATRHELHRIADEREQRVTRSGARRSSPERCPTCTFQEESAGRLAFFLGALLRRTHSLDRYGDPALFCMPHFVRIADGLGSKDLERFLRLQRDAAQRALAKLGTPANPLDDRTDDIRQAAKLAVGIPPEAVPVPAPRTTGEPGSPRDHSFQFARRLRDPSSCPVCTEVMGAWGDWTVGLERLVEAREPVNDLLPLCRLHVWAYLLHASPVLGALAAQAALDSADTALHMALEAGWGEKARQETMDLPAWRRAFTGRKPAARAMETLRVLSPRCPVCERVALAEDRALDLLSALLLSGRHIHAYERGHGLCARHLGKVLRRRLDAEVRSVLLRAGAATVAGLLWELEESGRKRAWTTRAEAHGTEQNAWQRALLRFSGAFGWQTTGLDS